MPSFFLPQFLRRRRRWQKLLALFLSSLLIHSSTAALAQDADVTILNSATASYTTASGTQIDATSNLISVSNEGEIINPVGALLGCDGQPLDSYAGFSVGLYEPDASGLDLGESVALAPTAGNNSVEPNLSNTNPFSLAIDEGRYNFLLNSEAQLNSPINAGLSQTDANAQYILVINPPDNSEFAERRVLIELLDNTAADGRSTLTYRVTSLDSSPISVDGELTVENATSVSQTSTLFPIGLEAAICESQQVRIVKSADRAAAQPGDTVIYRLAVQSLTTVEIDSIVAVDTLPVGFELIEDTVSAQLEGNPVEISTRVRGNRIEFRVAEAVAAEQTLDIIYAVRITPDALRGSGQNSATVSAQRTDSGFELQDGPSSHRMNLEPGILSDCGTLIGRVFEDKNFDGEQQSGEAGIPNAVIFLDDGNRIVTDADGLFSVQKMLPGQRVGTLDIASLPGYTLAPNLYFNERNSHSRLVNLAPGGLVKMNFGVTPTFQEVNN